LQIDDPKIWQGRQVMKKTKFPGDVSTASLGKEWHRQNRFTPQQ